MQHFVSCLQQSHWSGTLFHRWHNAIVSSITGGKAMDRAQQQIENNISDSEVLDAKDNVLDFSSTLKDLRRQVDPNLVRQREGWRDRSGNIQMIDYVEWHTVADILDENTPSWSHSVKDIRTIGDFVTITVAITIDGVTREGIGTGLSQSETGIKKAEHDALKRAAVKFGIARELYRKDPETAEVTEQPLLRFPRDPVAKNISEMA